MGRLPISLSLSHSTTLANWKKYQIHRIRPVNLNYHLQTPNEGWSEIITCKVEVFRAAPEVLAGHKKGDGEHLPGGEPTHRAYYHDSLRLQQPVQCEVIEIQKQKKYKYKYKYKYKRRQRASARRWTNPLNSLLWSSSPVKRLTKFPKPIWTIVPIVKY